ncbi:hypothetical protein [Sphingomonas jatrophae]|uniref:Uncharacterized protein n=1 Tax=Sphingomonas jatrophae TaxID=1166337 RepID=A0A1I6JHR7_9SPHN|nr:hypothetical protein [Sphingomonas jatrophae]SFR78491.1 hypothetical protein SAMN05192580_0287 [Sphingomonas jatrophae]
MARPIDIHLPGGTILLTPPGLLPDRLIGSKFAVRDGRALIRLRASATGLSDLRRAFHLLGLHVDPRFAGDLGLIGALEQAVARRRLDLHWLPEDCAGEVTPRADLRDRVPRHVRDWFAAEKVREALTRARPRMRRKYDRLMEQLLEPKHLVVALPLILDLAEPKGGGELLAFAFSAGRWEGPTAMEALAKATAECIVADDERMLERAADAYADALTALDSLVLGRFVARLGTKGIQPNAPPVESKIKAAAARPAPRPAPVRVEPKPAAKPAQKASIATEPTPEPKKAPAAEPACRLTSMKLTCEHGRTAGAEKILEVVPKSTASIGDKITSRMTMAGGCGSHPSYAIDGFFTYRGKGATFDFLAKTFDASIRGLFSLKNVTPHTYSVSGNACAGGDTYQVRAYPPGQISGKFDVSGFVERIADALKYLPMAPDSPLKLLRGAITYAGAWKEDEGSWKAFYEMSVGGGYDPLVGLVYDGPVYPVTLVPGFMSKWGVEAGLFWDIALGVGLSVTAVGKYWPHDNKTAWNDLKVEGGGAASGGFSLRLELCSPKVVKAAIKGTIGVEAKASSTSTRNSPNIELEFNMQFTGAKGIITLAAAFELLEWNREFQLLQPRPLFDPPLKKTL